MPPELLPYTSTGVRPDVIFNPPAVFKRKTYGHIYLPTIAKLAALLGCPIDCTNYSTIRSDEELCDLFHKLGLHEDACETMYDPHTGRPYKCRIFFANHYWERQMHLVENKINVRSGGSKDMVTGQPTKGKKHGGGQSFDRMAFDANVASGICELMRDTHLTQGSKIKVAFCNRCHNTMGYFNRETNQWVCPRCGSHPDMTIREIPPAANLITHIFNGLHISIDYFNKL
jgi:DNA-directed RNA polymerase beta subunit